MNIRELRKNDEDEIADIWYETSKTAHFFLDDEMLQTHKSEVKEKYLPAAQTWVAEDEGNLCGFISLMDNYIGALFIHPKYQGRGIGTELIKRASVEKDVLTVGVYAKNENARKFYEKMGFTFVGQELQAETGEIVLNMTLDK